MSNCHVRDSLLDVMIALIEDFRDTYPTLGGDLDRDIRNLRRSVEQRGLTLLVSDLPAVGKHLDRCLCDGQYSLPGLPLTKRVSGKVRLPKFLRGLYLLVFDGSGRLRDDYDVEAILFLRQILYVGKKVKLHCGQQKVREAIREFQQTDSELPIPETVWSQENPSYDNFRILYRGFARSPIYRKRIEEGYPSTLYILGYELGVVLEKLDLVSQLISTSLGDYNFRDWRFRHGPGVVSTASRGTSKYYWRSWSNRLESAFPIAECGYHNFASWAGNVDMQEADSVEPYSKLIDVPKTFSGPRLIAAEPGEHQWCQQNIWDYFCHRVEHSWISHFVRFRDQTRNQDLCRKGSEDTLLATVDLSSASDRVSCHAVGQFFRSNLRLLHALQASRTRANYQDIDENSSELIALRKFSTMGNACTFPVQSLMFLGIALASILTVRKMRVTLPNVLSLSEEVAVFGDDIIVPIDCREVFSRILEVLHFKVNDSKTYWDAASLREKCVAFRESCGVDAFAGVDVTPVYWRAPCEGTPESIATTVATANNFHRKFYLRAANVIASTTPKGLHIPTVPVDSGAFAFKSFSKGESGLKTRFNPELQRSESLAAVVSTKQEKTPANDDTALLQFFTELPDPMSPWKSGTAQVPVSKIRNRWVPTSSLE